MSNQPTYTYIDLLRITPEASEAELKDIENTVKDECHLYDPYVFKMALKLFDAKR